MAVVIDTKASFYPVNGEINLYQYEVALLYMLFAPFVFALPQTSNRVLAIVRRIYWVTVSSVFCFYAVGILAAIFIA